MNSTNQLQSFSGEEPEPKQSMTSANKQTTTGPVKKTDRELKQFALIVGLGFTLIGSFMLWRGRSFGLPLVGFAGALLLLGVIAPRLLIPFEIVWMKLGHVLSLIMTPLIMSLIFFLAITPMALLLKVLRKDLLQRKLDPNQSSYWIPAEKDGPSSRPYLPY